MFCGVEVSQPVIDDSIGACHYCRKRLDDSPNFCSQRIHEDFAPLDDPPFARNYLRNNVDGKLLKKQQKMDETAERKRDQMKDP